jgi:hypothetical protein
MSKKPATLSASLVAVKGAAAPAPDMLGRGALAVATPIPGVAEGPGVALQRPLEREGKSALAPLNFRVSAAFRREFKTYAARHDLKLNELLRRSFEAYRRAHSA